MSDHIKLKDILETVLELNSDEYTEDISIENNEKWDSIKHLQLMSTIEQEFGITLGDDDLLNLTSLESIKKHLEEV